jgi:hypothetical protein
VHIVGRDQRHHITAAQATLVRKAELGMGHQGIRL